MSIECVFCERDYVILTDHHLIPKSRHKRLRRRVNKEKLKETVATCVDCHKHIHKMFTETKLAKELNTISLLVETEEMQRFTKWIKRF